MSVHKKLEDILREELSRCERAIKAGDMALALRNVKAAASKLSALNSPIKRLEREAKQ